MLSNHLVQFLSFFRTFQTFWVQPQLHGISLAVKELLITMLLIVSDCRASSWGSR